MDIESAVARWRRVVEGEEPVEAVLAADCVFYSPVVYRPLEGAEVAARYLRAAGEVFAVATARADEDGWAPFRYRTEIVGGRHAALEFEVTIDGTYANGVDLITFDDDGLITEFKVFMRPLRALTLMAEMMGIRLTAE